MKKKILSSLISIAVLSVLIYGKIQFYFFFWKEPRYNEGPRDWKKCSQKTGFRNIEVLFYMFLLPGWEISFDIIPRTPCIEIRYIEDQLYLCISLWCRLRPPAGQQVWGCMYEIEKNADQQIYFRHFPTLFYSGKQWEKETAKSERYVITRKHFDDWSLKAPVPILLALQ